MQQKDKVQHWTLHASFLTQNFGHIGTRWVRLEEVASVDFCSGSASATDFAVLADTTFALQVTPVPELASELGCLHVSPDFLHRLVPDVAHTVTFIEAAGADVTVFQKPHVPAADEALPKKHVVEPVIKVGHAPLFCDAGEEGTVHVNANFTLIFLHQIVDSIQNRLILLRGGSQLQMLLGSANRNIVMVNYTSSVKFVT